MDAEIKTPIKVALIGMDERSTARMATLFKVAFKGRCECAQGTDANLSIVDLDGEDNIWEKYLQQYPELPAIVMSESHVAIEGVSYVAKPAKLNLLWDCIFNLVTGLPPASDIIKPPAITRLPRHYHHQLQTKKHRGSAPLPAQWMASSLPQRLVQRSCKGRACRKTLLFFSIPMTIC